MGVGDIVRWVVWGRQDGVRASIRARLGVLTWVDRRPPPPPPAEKTVRPDEPPARAGWRRMLASSDLGEGALTEVVVNGRRYALARIGGQVHAIDGICAHAAGPLGEGHLDGHLLTCPVHGWSYDLRTGVSTVDPAVSLPLFPVAEENGIIWLLP